MRPASTCVRAAPTSCSRTSPSFARSDNSVNATTIVTIAATSTPSPSSPPPPPLSTALPRQPPLRRQRSRHRLLHCFLLRLRPSCSGHLLYGVSADASAFTTASDSASAPRARSPSLRPLLRPLLGRRSSIQGEWGGVFDARPSDLGIRDCPTQRGSTPSLGWSPSTAAISGPIKVRREIVRSAETRPAETSFTTPRSSRHRSLRMGRPDRALSTAVQDCPS